MTTEMKTLSSTAKSFKSTPNRQSNWMRHLNQSKSIRLRRQVSTLAAMKRDDDLNKSRQQEAAIFASDSSRDQKRLEMSGQLLLLLRLQHQLKGGCGGDLGRVSINHVGVDRDGDDGDARQRATEAATITSGIPHPMISSVKSKSSRRKYGRQNHHLKTKRIITEMKTASTRGVRARIPLLTLAVMVASIVCCSNLIGHCNCDRTSSNPFSGHHANDLAMADTNKSMATTMTLLNRPSMLVNQAIQSSLGKINARNDRPVRESVAASKKNHMEKLLSSMADSIERQHLRLSAPSGKSSFASAAITKPSKFDSSSLDGRRETNSITRHDDFLRDIVVSHERRHQPAKMASANGGNKYNKPSMLLPGGSKADQELRQIILMHELATPASGASASKRKTTATQQMTTDSAGANNETGATAARWPGAKLLSMLPKDLVLKANLKSIVSANFLSGHSKRMLSKDMTQTGPNQHGLSGKGSSDTSTITGSPFTPRANAKNYLMGHILGLGQMLMTQPKPTASSRNLFVQHVNGVLPSEAPSAAQSSDEQPVYSQPANKFRPANSGQKPKKSHHHESQLSISLDDQQKRQRTDTTTASAGSNSDTELLSGSVGWQPSNDVTKTTSSPVPKAAGNGARKNVWLMDSATHLAQTYFKDSFRDLLTLSQLPIFSGGPVSTAPSDLEPGGKKWLANKQATEQIHGNRTNSMEDLLRYVYILGNVGVRRKRDPLKALGSHSYSAPNAIGSLPASHSQLNKRPLLSLLADRPKPITSLIKLPPPKILTGKSKLSFFLAPNSDLNSRGVMWDMATDPTLAVTMFHLLERASVALPLGFLFMPFVHMIRHPLGGLNSLNLGRILPARASHRSVDFEELAKRLDMMDKILSRSMRPTHRDASVMG